MVDTNRLDMKKTLIFLIVFIVVLLVYYKKILTIQDNETKPKQMIKRILYIFIIIGLINTFSYTTDKTLKIYSIKNITPKKYLQNSKKLL